MIFVNDQLRTRKIAMTYRSPGNPGAMPGSFIIPKIKAARGRGELYIYQPVNEIYTQRFSKLFNMVPDPLSIHRSIEDISGLKTEYVEIDSVEHDTHLGDMPYYSTLEKFGDNVYGGIPMHLSIADAFTSGNKCDIRIPREFLFGWKKLKENAFRIEKQDPEYENLVRKKILFRNLNDTNYRLTCNIEESAYKELERGKKFVKSFETSIEDTIIRSFYAYLPLTDGEITYNFPVRDEEEFDPGEGFNVGTKLHNEMSWLKKKLDDNGFGVSKIYYNAFVVQKDETVTPLTMRGGMIRISDEDGNEYDPIYVGDDINIEYFGTLAKSHHVIVTKTSPREKIAPLKKDESFKTSRYIG